MQGQDGKRQTIRIGRREFSAAGVLALLGGVSVTISACGGGGGGSSPTAPSNPSPPLAAGDKAGSISANHGHTAVLTAAQIQAGQQVTLDIRGDANHSHSVSFSAAEIQAIAAGTRTSRVSSSDDAHNHNVTFN